MCRTVLRAGSVCLCLVLFTPACGETTSPGARGPTAVQIALGHLEATVEDTAHNAFPHTEPLPATDNGSVFDCTDPRAGSGLVQTRYAVDVDLHVPVDRAVANVRSLWENRGYEVVLRESHPPSVAAQETDGYEYEFVPARGRATIAGTTPCLQP